MKIFIFISIIVFIFLGLSNSLDEIFSEKRILIREKKLRIKCSLFLLVKNLTLGIFALFQAVIYFAVSSVILEIRGGIFCICGLPAPFSFYGFFDWTPRVSSIKRQEGNGQHPSNCIYSTDDFCRCCY